MTDTDTDLNQPMQPTRPHRLERPLAGRWAAGVARGLADDWAIPTWIVRLGFVFLTPVGGLGFLLYTIGWLFIPREGETDPLVSRWVDQLKDRQAWLGAALVAAAAIIVLSSLNVVDTGLIWAGVLLVFGVLLYRGDLGALTTPSPSRPSPPEPMELDGLEDRLVEGEPEPFDDGDRDAPSTPALTERPPAAPRPPREPSYLGRLTLGAVLVTIGVMVAFDVSGVTHPTSRHYLAAPVLVIGVGLLVGTFVGRSRGLIVLGIALTPVALVGALVDMPLDGEYGDIDVFATTPDELASTYRLTGGDVYLDLRGLELTGETVAVDAKVGVGNISVALPVAYHIEIDGRVGLGELDVLEWASDGLSLDRVTTRTGAGGTILLDLEVGVGRISVRDYAEFPGPFAFGDPRSVFMPASIDELEPTYFLPRGALELDLRSILPPAANEGREVVVTATVGQGELVVLLPPWLNANIAARAGSGVLDILGNQIVGLNLVDEVLVEGEGEADMALVLAVEQGTIVVVRP